jgi:ELWxxDGT repeat protein
MRLHLRAVRLLPLLLPILLLPRGEAFGQTCTPDPRQVGTFTNPGAMIRGMAGVNQRLILAVKDGANGYGIWRLEDNETFTPLPAAGGRPWPPNVDDISAFTVMGQQLFFVLSVQQDNYLWATNDTQTAIYQVGSAFPASLLQGLGLTVLGGRLYFVSQDPSQVPRLWMSDGTSAQPSPVTDDRGNVLTVLETKPVVMGGRLFFSAVHPTLGQELWVIDQPGGPASLFEDVWQGGSSAPESLTVVGENLFFIALDTPFQNKSLWVRRKGEMQSERIAGPGELGGAHGPLLELTAVDDKLFFHFSGDSGDELWVSRGRTDNTRIVKEIQDAGSGSFPHDLTAVGRMLFFVANDGNTGNEPWRSDGTADGTSIVDDFYRDFANDPPESAELKAGAGVLLLSVYGASSNRQLWSVSDTPPRQLTSIGLGPAVSNPHAMTVLGSNLYFAAKPASQPDDELFVLGLNKVDCNKPSVTCPGPLNVEAASPAGAYVFLPPPVQMSDDSFTPLTVSYSTGPFALFGLDNSMPAFITVRDMAGNAETCPVTVNVRDTMAPELVCPADLTVEAEDPEGADVSFPVEAQDAASGLDFVNASPASGEHFPLGRETQVTITARDRKGNTTPCEFSVTVKDTQPPKLICPQDIVRVATSAEPITLTYAPLLLEDPTGATLEEAQPPSGSAFGLGRTPVTLKAKDGVNNRSSCTFTVHIVDPVAPTITCPGPQQAVATEPEGAVVEFEASAEDALGPPSLLYSSEPGSTFPVGETTVTATATDSDGNKASCSFTVTVTRPGQEVPPEGCACRAGSASASVYWLLLALAPLWARRRIGRLAR